MNRDQKEATKIAHESMEIAKDIGVLAYGLGRSITYLMVEPKRAAAQIVLAAQNVDALGERMLNLSERIVKWDETRIITKVAKPLVDAHHNPIK